MHARARRLATLRWSAPLVAALLAIAPRPSRADIAPPPDHPDSHCTEAEQCPNGIYCPYAYKPGKAPAPDEVPVGEECRTDALKRGLERRCRKGGNYTGDELFCPKGETGSWSPPGSASSGVCALSPAEPTPPRDLLFAVVLSLLAIVSRRGRRAARTSTRS